MILLRNPDRINDVIIEFHKKWQEYPDLRFGQLVENIIVSHHNNRTSVCGVENDLWGWEDEQWIKAIKDFKTNYVKGK